MTNITIHEGIATFESGEQVEATVEQIKALPRLIHQFKHLLHYAETPGDFSLDDIGEMLEEGSVLMRSCGRRRNPMSNYPGIDYSGPGSTANRDVATGIRYGVISQNSIQPDVMSDIWSEARDLSYEAAQEEAQTAILKACDLDTDEERRNRLAMILEDFVRGSKIDARIDDILDLEEDPRFIKREHAWEIVCEDFGDAYSMGDSGERSWLWEKDGYRLGNCLQTDVFVSRSPYFTYAQFCSPCVPGAGNLDHPYKYEGNMSPDSSAFALCLNMCATDDGWPKVFCLGHDFFENEEAPYPVFSVATGKRVVMVEKKEKCPKCGGVPYVGAGGPDEVVEPACWRCGGLGYEVKKVEVEQ